MIQLSTVLIIVKTLKKVKNINFRNSETDQLNGPTTIKNTGQNSDKTK